MLEKIREKVSELEKQIERVQKIEKLVENGNASNTQLGEDIQKMLLINARMNEMFLNYVREQKEKRDKRVAKNINDLGYPL